VSGYFLLDFLEQVSEVMQAADRRAVSVLVDSGVFTHGAQQNGMFDMDQGNAPTKQRQSQFLIRSRKTTLYAAALEKKTFHFRHIVSRIVAGGRLALALIGPEAISNLDDALWPEGTDTLPLEFFEGKMQIAFLFCRGPWLTRGR